MRDCWPGRSACHGKPGDVAGFVLTRVLAAAAAILIVIVVAGLVLAHQASGPAAGWAAPPGMTGCGRGRAG